MAQKKVTQIKGGQNLSPWSKRRRRTI